MIKITTGSAEETVALGRKLGNILEGGDTLCLNGDLGTGKTAFTGGIAKALNIGGYITSPTFTIVNEYKGRLPLYHFDVYRIANPDDMFETGFDEYIGGDGIVVIEWADQIRDILPPERIEVYLERGSNAGTAVDDRIITIDFIGMRYSEYEGRFAL
jgi:tRNA threonylcarbamoyladenosine biosynthesis protein TsaE